MMTVCFERFEESIDKHVSFSTHSSNPSKQTVIITYKFMTFYFILKNLPASRAHSHGALRSQV